MVYTIRNDSLTNIARGTGKETLMQNIWLFPEGVTAQLTDYAGNPKTVGVETGDRLELTARNGVTKE